MPCFDLDILRSFVLMNDLGSMARVAQAQARTQSAVSLQFTRLEDQLGAPVFAKQGRRLVLTDVGLALLGHARKLVELNDATFSLLQSTQGHGKVVLGIPQDIAEAWLPEVLAEFTRRHPNVELTVRVGRSLRLVDSFKRGKLDLVMYWGKSDSLAGAKRVVRRSMQWLGCVGLEALAKPLPLVVFDGLCTFRKAGEVALRKSSVPYRIAFASKSPSGILAAVAAGLGVTVRTLVERPTRVQALDAREFGLPRLPTIDLYMKIGRAEHEAVEHLGALLTAKLEQHGE